MEFLLILGIGILVWIIYTYGSHLLLALGLVVVGLVVFLIILFFTENKKTDNDKIHYAKDIEHYAHILYELQCMCSTWDGSVFITHNCRPNIKLDTYAHHPNNNMLYFRVHLESYQPTAIRAYYEGHYDWGFPYDEEHFKESEIYRFFPDKYFVYIDKDVVFESIKKEIILYHCEEWSADSSDWYFHYPINCPEKFRGSGREAFKHYIEEACSQIKKNQKEETSSFAPSIADPQPSNTKTPILEHQSTEKTQSDRECNISANLRKEDSGNIYHIRFGTDEHNYIDGYIEKYINFDKYSSEKNIHISLTKQSKNDCITITINGKQIELNCWVLAYGGEKIILTDSNNHQVIYTVILS